METIQGYSLFSFPLLFKSYYVVWKLLSMKFLSLRNFMFKSYYVVWKPIWQLIRVSPTFCLNRTMQYGNRNRTEKIRCICGRFKSYYVVWKQFWKNTRYFARYQFKSYYVVWKPRTPNAYFSFVSLFKSYYVVWKPLTISHAENADYSLNRTMQYGNLRK